MADQGFRRPRRHHFRFRGVDLNTPIDSPKREGTLARAVNMTSDIDGTLVPRLGFANLYGANLVVAGQTPVHSVRRISDNDSGLWARIIATGTHLAAELSTAAGSASSIETGFTSQPFTSAVWRPESSAKPYLYVGNDGKMRKVAVDGTDKQIGLPAPTSPPTVTIEGPRAVEVSDMESAAAWTQGGVAGAPTAAARVNTTLEATAGVIFDSGTTGWGCFRPVSMTDIGPGSLLDFLVPGPATEVVRVTEVHRAGPATTIERIIYESGTSGVCVIQPVIPSAEFVQNAVVKIVNGGTTEYCRILSIVQGVNGGRCIRVSTTNTFAAGHTLQVVNSFRAYCNGGTSNGDPISQDYIQSVLTGAGTATLTDTVAIDLTKLSYLWTGSLGFMPMYDDDYFSMSFYATDLSKITNIRIMFALDTGSFTQNFFYRTIEQSVLVAAAKNTQTAAEIARRTRIKQINELARTAGTRKIFDPEQEGDAWTNYVDYLTDQGRLTPIPEDPNNGLPSGETGTGDNQWSELRWTRRSCERVGSASDKGWSNVDAVRIEVTVTAAITIRFNSLHAHGGGELNVDDTVDTIEYTYRYRGRDSSTGTVSDYSPECLERIDAKRDRAVLTLTQHPSAECDQLDIERWGGTNFQWLLVGSVANSATPTYTDNLNDVAALNNAPFSDQRVLQPWVRFGARKAGTASVVAGNMVTDNGSNALSGTDIVPGTRVIVNGIAAAIRRVLSTTKWELDRSIGGAATVAWEMPVEVRFGRPLGAIWRHDVPVGGGSIGVLFACDGIYLRWSMGKNPDATRSTNFLEMTEGNDPLVMGFSHNGRCGVFTTKRLFWITGDPVSGFRADHVPDSDGLFSRWALAVDPNYGIAWLSPKFRINLSDGGTPNDITTRDLAPLFGIEPGGITPASVNSIKAPKIDTTEAIHLRMDFADDGSLLFFYRDASANRACLRYDRNREAWEPYEFGRPVVFAHAEEGLGIRSLLVGDAEGKLHQYGGSAAPKLDDGTAFTWQAQPFVENFGDSRPMKRMGDLEVDAHPNSQTINVEAALDNYTLDMARAAGVTALGTITGATQQQKLFDIQSGNGARGKNIGIRLYGTAATGTRPRIYSWEPSVLAYPEDTKLRAAQWQDCGHPGEKYIKGVVIHSDTYNLVKAVRIEKDGGTLIESINLQHNGERRETIIFTSPTKASLVRIATADTDDWTLIDWQWIFDKDVSDDAKIWSNAGYDGDKYMQAVVLHADTFNVAKVLQIQKDGGTVIDTVTITHNGERRETYAFDVTSDPLRIARLLRIVESDTSVAWSLLGVEWVFNKEPKQAKVWEIQFSGLQSADYFHAFQILLAHRSSANITMETFVDGSSTAWATNTITHSSGAMDKTAPIVLPAAKTKLIKWRLESTADFRLYLSDCAVWVMGYDGGDYQMVRPFGGPHMDRGAEA